MARMTVADLQQLKRDGKKIAAAVVYDVPMTQIFEQAGVDFLSIGDSFASYLFSADMDAVTTEEMLPFAKAVLRGAEHAVISVDIPVGVCTAGAKEVGAATRLIKSETDANMVKLYIPEGEEGILEEITAVLDAGLAAYCRLRYPGENGNARRPGTQEEHEYVLKWAHAMEDAGASMIDLYMGTPESYGLVADAVSIPVIGGQWATSGGDGKIFIYPNLLGYKGELDRKDGKPTVARFMYNILAPELAAIHSGTWS